MAACPTSAVRPTKVEYDGKMVNSIAIKRMTAACIAATATPCARPLPIADGEGDGITIMIGGKVSNRITWPKFSKVVVAYIPNDPPRWTELVETVKKDCPCLCQRCPQI